MIKFTFPHLQRQHYFSLLSRGNYSVSTKCSFLHHFEKSDTASSLSFQHVGSVLSQGNCLTKSSNIQHTSVRFKSHFDMNSVKAIHVFVIDPYIPNENLSVKDLFDKDGRKLVTERLKKFFMTCYSTIQLRNKLGKWKPILFAQEAQEMYSKTIEAIWKKDREEIRKHTSDGFYYSLVSKIKASEKKNKPLSFPKIIRFVDRPRVVHKVATKAQLKENEPDDTKQVAQVTVRLSYDKVNKANPNGLPQRAVDYIILERWIADKNDRWKIIGIFKKVKGEHILDTEH